MKNFFIKCIAVVFLSTVSPDQMKAEMLRVKTEKTIEMTGRRSDVLEIRPDRKVIKTIDRDVSRKIRKMAGIKAVDIIAIVLLAALAAFFLVLGLGLLLTPLITSDMLGTALGLGLPCLGLGILFLVRMIKRIKKNIHAGREEIPQRPPTLKKSEEPKQ